ncbi:MAG TPA: divergent polysaccharide deacetylase family protein [Devosia sp.]|nr:divergent polysaccharide deacetylase family protein [Devosia sp.]
MSTRSRLPLARIAIALIVLIIGGAALRILLVSDPNGGRPTTETAINSTRNANTVAGNVAAADATQSATITAGPEMPVDGPQVTKIGDDVPDGNVAMTGDMMFDKDGLAPALLEQTDHGAIPRIAADGATPFETYSRPSLTPATASGKLLIAIVVTGLGLNEQGTAAAINGLPQNVSLAFAPYGKGLQRSVADARAAGHEILLQVPLEPFDYPDNDPGPDTLLTGQAPRDNLEKLFTVMGKFGGYVGLMNYMGARFTTSAADFGPMMEELGTRGLGYVDDGSSNRSLAPQLAAANAVQFGRADMALDTNPARAPILEALKALEAKAAERGSAIGVISGLPVSIATVADWAKTAADRNIEIVPVSALMAKP